MKLKEVLKESYHLSEGEILILFNNMEMVSYSKDDIVLEEGKMDYYIYFVESGIIRNFISRNGIDVTLWLITEGGSPYLSRLTEVTTSKMAIDAVEDCVLWKISKKYFSKLCRESIAFANFGRELLEHQLSETEIYWTDYYWLDKKKQYQLMIKQQPQLLQRIPLAKIASYLNVTPQSLSRIRATID